jgi:hypothetical protein
MVSALHVALVIALIIAAKTRVLLTAVPNPIELLVLFPDTEDRIVSGETVDREMWHGQNQIAVV